MADSNSNRRKVLKLIGTACSSPWMFSLENPNRRATAAANDSPKRPNILLLIADDHAAYISGTYGNPQARTPNLDRLAQSGMQFNHAYVNCPMCTPSRQSLLTGRLPHAVGVTQLRTALSAEAVTLAEVLKTSGYATGAIGKMHFNSSLKHGFDVRLDLQEHRDYLQQHPPRPIPAEAEVLPRWQPFKDPARIWLNSMTWPYGAYEDDMPGTWFERQAQEFLKENRERPFFLTVSFYEPHSPFHFPLEYRHRFDPFSFQVPEVHPQDAWQIPEIFRDLTLKEKQGIIASYYTATEFMDRNVGRVLDALDANGLRENTVVIYLGDNGYSLGQHGRFEKHCHFEPAWRVPLIIRLPDHERSNSQCDALVELIDLFPTVTALCDAVNPLEVEGRSLVSILKGETSTHRDFVFSEYYDNEEAAVRTSRYKYIYSTGKREREDGYKTGLPLPGRTKLLYDVQNDPDELHDLAGQAEYAKLIAELEDNMLQRFNASHPLADECPSGGSVEERLDYYLMYREE